MPPIPVTHFTNRQARQFLLLWHGLLGPYRFVGKTGALEFVRQAGCIQFDPVDACGKNAELTLQSRVKGFTKAMLGELLYADRALVDYPDKNLAILPVEDWPYFARYRRAARENGAQFEALGALEAQALAYIRANGPVSAEELPIAGKIHWHSSIHWSGNWSGESNAARSVLEQLYSTGELIIHHKKGARKFYDLAANHLPAALLSAPDPLLEEDEHLKWRVLRRIGAVGLLWNRPSDAWLNIWGLKAAQREEAFAQLVEEGKICQARVDGVRTPLYFRAEALPLAHAVCAGVSPRPRCEVIAALDCLLWDRKWIRELFGFAYQWEIYVPANQRKFGYYVLPLLWGERFVGRVEAVADAKARTLRVKNLWLEDGVRCTKTLQAAIDGCLKRLAKFNLCDQVAGDVESFSTSH